MIIQQHAEKQSPLTCSVTYDQLIEQIEHPVITDSCPQVYTLSAFRDAILGDVPCVLRGGFDVDPEPIIDAILEAAPYRWVPTEQGSGDIRSKEWHYSIKKLESAIKDQDYIAQFPLHQHLNLDVKKVTSFLSELGIDSRIENCWFGPPDTRTPHHVDPFSNVYVAIFGTKFFQIVEPSAAAESYIKPLGGSLRNVGSVANAQLSRNAGLENTSIWDVTLEPGDALYIPKAYWHMAQSYSWHLGMSFWYQRE